MAKLLPLLLFLLLGCGKEVSIPNHLEKQSSITMPGDEKEKLLIGMLNRGSSEITFGQPLEGVTFELDGKSYKFGKFHSQQAYNFINALPKGARVSVKLRGEVRSDEVVVSLIE